MSNAMERRTGAWLVALSLAVLLAAGLIIVGLGKKMAVSTTPEPSTAQEAPVAPSSN